ncbi:MAG: HD domain-containing phosphohydrolase, partial [Thermodesulfobacteriota bacterium]
DHVLLKPGRLTPEEFRIMQRHTEIGFRLLSSSNWEILDLGASIALTHHEKFNGSGYPRGLAGTDIPVEGRIAAVADVFDALTSDRVYKKAMPVSQAVAILEEGRGLHFDPMFLDLFLASLAEIDELRQRYADHGPVDKDRSVQ